MSFAPKRNFRVGAILCLGLVSSQAFFFCAQTALAKMKMTGVKSESQQAILLFGCATHLKNLNVSVSAERCRRAPDLPLIGRLNLAERMFITHCRQYMRYPSYYFFATTGNAVSSLLTLPTKAASSLSIQTLKLRLPKLIAPNTRQKMTRIPTLTQTIPRPPRVNPTAKKAYLVNPPESLGVKFNRLNIYLRDNGAFEVDAHFDTTHIETAYRRFVDFFLQAAADIPALNGWENFPNAKKLIPNTNGWENELGEQIFFPDANESLCVDINEDFIYIFGKFNQHSTAPVAEPQLELTADNHDKVTISTDQTASLQPASLLVDVDADISASKEITLAQRADRIRSLQADVQRGIIQIGFELIAAKEQVGHGNWSHWLDKEFSWSDRTARYFMACAERFGKRNTYSDLPPSTLKAMLTLPEGDEEDFIDAQAAAGTPVEKQSAREIQRNVKAFKKQRATKKVPDDDKLPTLQGLSLPLDELNDTPPDSLVTTEPELADDLHDDRANVTTEDTDDSPAIVDRDSDSNALPATDLIPAPINPSTTVVTNLVDTPAQITAVNVLISETNDLQQLRAIRFSLTETLASLDSKLEELAQEN